EALITYLTQKRVDVISGVEWITNLSSTNEEKRVLLQKNPLLAFSILAETSQMNEIKQTLKTFKKELTIPIIFLDRLQLNSQAQKERFFELKEYLFIFHQ